MSNIQAPRGLAAPSLQANSKQDGQGNGSGGMYFGQYPQEEQDQFMGSSYISPDTVDLNDIPFLPPIFGFLPKALKAWKTAVAKVFYQNNAKQHD